MKRVVEFLINRIKLFKLEYNKLTKEELITTISSNIITHGLLISVLIFYFNQPIIPCFIGYSIGLLISKIFIEPKFRKFLNISK